MDKPKEYWLGRKEDQQYWVMFQSKHDAWSIAEDKNPIHVIEYSAYEQLKQKLQEYEERETRYNEFLEQRKALGKAMDDLADVLYKTNKPNVVATRDGFRTTKTTEEIIKEMKNKIHD